MVFKTGRGCESLASMKRRAAPSVQMVILHFEKLTLCFCKRGRSSVKTKKGSRRIKHLRICRRCWTIKRAKEEIRRAGIRWVRGVKSDVVGAHRKSQKHRVAQ